MHTVRALCAGVGAHVRLPQSGARGSRQGLSEPRRRVRYQGSRRWDADGAIVLSLRANVQRALMEPWSRHKRSSTHNARTGHERLARGGGIRRLSFPPAFACRATPCPPCTATAPRQALSLCASRLVREDKDEQVEQLSGALGASAAGGQPVAVLPRQRDLQWPTACASVAHRRAPPVREAWRGERAWSPLRSRSRGRPVYDRDRAPSCSSEAVCGAPRACGRGPTVWTPMRKHVDPFFPRADPYAAAAATAAGACERAR